LCNRHTVPQLLFNKPRPIVLGLTQISIRPLP
jgi:hypothetical protein